MSRIEEALVKAEQAKDLLAEIDELVSEEYEATSPENLEAQVLLALVGSSIQAMYDGITLDAMRRLRTLARDQAPKAEVHSANKMFK